MGNELRLKSQSNHGLRVSFSFAALLFVFVSAAPLVAAQQADFQDEVAAVQRSSSETAKLLSSSNALQRRQAAEELARASATEHMRLVEGYRVQEKDSRVKLALDWALFRMGKQQALFSLVRALDSSRYEQAQQYLSQIDSPEPLHIFISRGNGNTQIRLLEVLARVGNAETLEKIKPLTESLDPTISDAAKFAEREITIRLEETPAIEPKRPRQTGKQDDDDMP